jgi:DNA-binding response OmpR family regulator
VNDLRPSVLVIDDDPGVLDIVRYALEEDGFRVETATDGEEALDTAEAGDYDVIVLDLMLPRLSGTEVCRRLRATGNPVPIVMLTARDAELDRIVGLELGADDYVVKPFSTRELASRLRAILRRQELDRDARGTVREIGGLRLDLSRYEVYVEGQRVQLTPSEFKLLALLSERPDHVISRRELLQHLWSSTYVGDEHAADVHISNLRRKIERDPENPERLMTIRGVGYKLAAG